MAGYCSIYVCVFLLRFLKQNITSKVTALSNVKEASLTKTYVYWTKTDLTIHSSTFRSLKCICYCTFVHSQPTACNMTVSHYLLITFSVMSMQYTLL